MYGHYGYYGASPNKAAPSPGSEHADSQGFMGLNWGSIVVAVAIGSVTAVFTALTVEYIRERRKMGKPQQHILTLTDGT
jgi:hypothetical protein